MFIVANANANAKAHTDVYACLLAIMHVQIQIRLNGIRRFGELPCSAHVSHSQAIAGRIKNIINCPDSSKPSDGQSNAHKIGLEKIFWNSLNRIDKVAALVELNVECIDRKNIAALCSENLQIHQVYLVVLTHAHCRK